jgi:hypothetical protein
MGSMSEIPTRPRNPHIPAVSTRPAPPWEAVELDPRARWMAVQRELTAPTSRPRRYDPVPPDSPADVERHRAELLAAVAGYHADHSPGAIALRVQEVS